MKTKIVSHMAEILQHKCLCKHAHMHGKSYTSMVNRFGVATKLRNSKRLTLEMNASDIRDLVEVRRPNVSC